MPSSPHSLCVVDGGDGGEGGGEQGAVLDDEGGAVLAGHEEAVAPVGGPGQAGGARQRVGLEQRGLGEGRVQDGGAGLRGGGQRSARPAKRGERSYIP